MDSRPRINLAQNIEALAPGGCFVYATGYDIQAEAMAKNIAAMWAAWKIYGMYA